MKFINFLRNFVTKPLRNLNVKDQDLKVKRIEQLTRENKKKIPTQKIMENNKMIKTKLIKHLKQIKN